MKLSFNKQPVPETNQLSLFKNDFKIGNPVWWNGFYTEFYSREMSKLHRGGYAIIQYDTKEDFLILRYKGLLYRTRYDNVEEVTLIPVRDITSLSKGCFIFYNSLSNNLFNYAFQFDYYIHDDVNDSYIIYSTDGGTIYTGKLNISEQLFIIKR